MSNDDAGWMFFCGALFGCLISGLLTAAVVGSAFQTEAIESGHGQYNTTTGEFEWKVIEGLTGKGNQ